jgi:LysM repeat protein
MTKFCLLIACFFTITVSAQEKLVIMGKASDMYVVHSASGTENLQNISGGFGLSLTKVSGYNKININSAAVLPKGTKIKIPLTKDNLLQHHSDNSAPVYHVVKKGENLYRLSQAYNKVPLASMREWNHLQKDAVKNGQQVIIGYMVNAKVPAITDKKTDPKKETVAANTDPVVPVADKKIVEKKEPATAQPVAKESPANNITTVLPKEVPKPIENKPVITEIKKKEEPVSSEYFPKEGDEGYFASGYADHAKEQTQQFHSGDAAVFKTISGWTDRKFYVLMNDVAPKTVVRITAPGNKSICAMVLGPLQETKGANGLLLRLSNSAASALGLTDPKFTVTVTYFE